MGCYFFDLFTNGHMLFWSQTNAPAQHTKVRQLLQSVTDRLRKAKKMINRRLRRPTWWKADDFFHFAQVITRSVIHCVEVLIVLDEGISTDVIEVLEDKKVSLHCSKHERGHLVGVLRVFVSTSIVNHNDIFLICIKHSTMQKGSPSSIHVLVLHVVTKKLQHVIGSLLLDLKHLLEQHFGARFVDLGRHLRGSDGDYLTCGEMQGRRSHPRGGGRSVESGRQM